MQVSSVGTNRFSASEIMENPYENKNNGTAETAFNNGQRKTEFDCITEWKTFCEEQILSNNINYIA